jgi:hypothetical protein
MFIIIKFKTVMSLGGMYVGYLRFLLLQIFVFDM